MTFVHSLIGANIYVLYYFIYSKQEFSEFAQYQIIASMILVLLEAPIIQLYIAGKNIKKFASFFIYAKILICTLSLLLLIIYKKEFYGLAYVGLILSGTSTWQVTTKTHLVNSIKIITALKIALLGIMLLNIKLIHFIQIYSIIAILITYIGLKDKSLNISDIKIVIRKYIKNLSYIVRPASESIAFNSALLIIVKNLGTISGSDFYLFIRMISSSVALAQNFLLTTESKLANIVNLSKNLATALILIALILPIIYFMNFNFSIPLKIFCIVLGCLSVIINQYLSSYLVKKYQKKYLDILNGGIFSIGILLISWGSFYFNNIIIVLSAYITLECLMGINSYFFGIKKYEV